MEMPSNNQTTPVRDRLEWFWYAASAIIALICAITNLYYPFVADQVVALSGAKAIAEGGILYVDFWDNKMPGLFSATPSLECTR
jgi:uncharacterized membrane protein HdeD (DUF308 family)